VTSGSGRGSNRLPELRAVIVTRDAEVKLAARQGLKAAIEAGVALLEGKEILGHGRFTPWVESLGLSGRTARLYMNLAANREKVETELATDTSLTIRAASKLLAGSGQRKIKPRLLPPQGCMLTGVAKLAGESHTIYAVQSTSPGYIHVGYICDRPVTGSDLQTLRRPVREDFLTRLEEFLGTSHLQFEFSSSPCEPQAVNPLDEILEEAT